MAGLFFGILQKKENFTSHYQLSSATSKLRRFSNMPIDSLQTLDVIEALENFLEIRRPPEDIRDKLDLSYRIEDQNVFIFEIRPQWNNPKKIMETDLAKATFVKEKNHWKVFWLRASLKWESYPLQPTVKTVREFAMLVAEDKGAHFFG